MQISDFLMASLSSALMENSFYRRMLAREADDDVLVQWYLCALDMLKTPQKVNARSRGISVKKVNVNIFSWEKFNRELIFINEYVGSLTYRFEWSSAGSRLAEYEVGPVTAACVLLRRVSLPRMCRDIENHFWDKCFRYDWCILWGTRKLAAEG